MLIFCVRHKYLLLSPSLSLCRLHVLYIFFLSVHPLIFLLNSRLHENIEKQSFLFLFMNVIAATIYLFICSVDIVRRTLRENETLRHTTNLEISFFLCTTCSTCGYGLLYWVDFTLVFSDHLESDRHAAQTAFIFRHSTEILDRLDQYDSLTEAILSI